MLCARHTVLRRIARVSRGTKDRSSVSSGFGLLTRWFNTAVSLQPQKPESQTRTNDNQIINTASSSPSNLSTDGLYSQASPLLSTSVPSPSSSSSSAIVEDLSSLRVCIVGSGPAAFYTAKYLLKDLPSIKIDIIERLPVPFGLVRYGVSPDHPEVKQVQHEFTRILTDARVRFYGNITIGEHLTIHDLRQYYHIIVLAYGAQSERTLKIPGSHLLGIIPARILVNWYNAHPAHSHHTFDLQRVKQVVIVGQGNVAIDCARMLLLSPTALQQTDIADHALQVLLKTHVHEVHLLGRRGPVQAAFTTAEFREVSELKDVQIKISLDELKEGEEGDGNIKELQSNRPKQRKMQLIKQIAQRQQQTNITSSSPTSSSAIKSLYIHFFSAPVEYIEDPHQSGHVGAVKVEKMKLIGEADRLTAIGTGIYHILPTQLVLESIGYRSEPLSSLPFDNEHHIIPTTSGRIWNTDRLYVSGWLKRGPTGIIGTNITDARETVNSILADMTGDEGEQRKVKIDHILATYNYPSFLSLLHSRHPHHRVVDTVGWERINNWELARGKDENRPRVKIVHLEDMLNIAGV